MGAGVPFRKRRCNNMGWKCVGVDRASALMAAVEYKSKFFTPCPDRISVYITQSFYLKKNGS